MPGDTAAVRAGEELNVSALAGYLSARGPITVEQFPSGHSNLTYLVTTEDREFVLRRPPLGPVAPKAHDMAREYGFLSAVHPHFPEAPRVLALCEDSSVLGAPFFVMERRRGVILRDAVPEEMNHPSRLSAEFTDCLVRLHAIDVETTGLIRLGKPQGFVERQVRGWTERWNRARTSDIAEMDSVATWLEGHLPVENRPCVVHNDYKLDNVMFSSDGRITAVLDWEMATVGDPLADLGLTLCYWVWASAPDVIPALTCQTGWYSREQMIDRYAAKTGRDLSHIAYYEVLGVFKLAVIIQQIFYRFHRGQTRDERFRDFDKRVVTLARTAAEIAEKHG